MKNYKSEAEFVYNEYCIKNDHKNCNKAHYCSQPCCSKLECKQCEIRNICLHPKE